MRRINYKSDFDFILKLKDGEGNDIGIPQYNWTAKFYTTTMLNAYVASNVDGTLTNCFDDEGQLHIVVNNHRLGTGVLKVEFNSEIPNDIYPDDSELIVVPVPLDIELTRAAAPAPEAFEVELMIPYITVDKGGQIDPSYIKDLGIVADSEAAFLAAAAKEVTENAKIRMIVWRTTDAENSGAGGTIFQEKRGNYFVVQ